MILRCTSALQQHPHQPLCVERIDAWMSSNRLKMNADKTQLLWLGTRQQLNAFEALAKMRGINVIIIIIIIISCL